MGKIANAEIVNDIKRTYSDPSVKLVCESHESMRDAMRAMLPLLEAVIAWHGEESKFLSGKKAWDDVSESCYRNMYSVASDYVNEVPSRIEPESVS